MGAEWEGQIGRGEEGERPMFSQTSGVKLYVNYHYTFLLSLL